MKLILSSIIALAFLTSCNYTVSCSVIDSAGPATDTMTETDTASPDVSPDISIPATAL